MNKNLNFFQLYFKTFVLTFQFMKKLFSAFSENHSSDYSFSNRHLSLSLDDAEAKSLLSNRLLLVSMQLFSLIFHIRSCMMNVRLNYCLDFRN